MLVQQKHTLQLLQQDAFVGSLSSQKLEDCLLLQFSWKMTRTMECPFSLALMLQKVSLLCQLRSFGSWTAVSVTRNFHPQPLKFLHLYLKSKDLRRQVGWYCTSVLSSLTVWTPPFAAHPQACHCSFGGPSSATCCAKDRGSSPLMFQARLDLRSEPSSLSRCGQASQKNGRLTSSKWTGAGRASRCWDCLPSRLSLGRGSPKLWPLRHSLAVCFVEPHLPLVNFPVSSWEWLFFVFLTLSLLRSCYFQNFCSHTKKMCLDFELLLLRYEVLTRSEVKCCCCRSSPPWSRSAWTALGLSQFAFQRRPSPSFCG